MNCARCEKKIRSAFVMFGLLLRMNGQATERESTSKSITWPRWSRKIEDEHKRKIL